MIVVLALLAIYLASRPASHPRLSVTYIQRINGGYGSWRLKFGITNVGTCTAFTSPGVGKIEVFNHTNLLTVAATSPLMKLVPGQGQFLSKRSCRRRRWIRLIADGDTLAFTHRMDFGFVLTVGNGVPVGPGSRINWLIPQRLKGIPLTVKGTSDWTQPPDLNQ